MAEGNGNDISPEARAEIRAATSEIEIHSEAEAQAAFMKLRSLEDQVLLAGRMSWARSMGLTFDGNRDMYGILGYKDVITSSDYRTRYQRGDIAGAIVDAYPDATWRSTMELIEDESKEDYTEFEQAWANFDKALGVQERLRRVDKLAGLSTYAILLIGDGASELDQPLRKVKPSKDSYRGIIYLTPFLGGGSIANGTVRSQRMAADDADATVWEYELDPSSPRFGLPKLYRLKRADLDNALPKPVHWSRVIHVAEGLLDDDVFGLPSLERVWNKLDDLDKVSGGGSEAFWLRANQGLHANIDKDMVLTSADSTLDKLRADMDAYRHGLTRWLRTRGVEINTLGSDVANFGPSQDAIITLISGAKRIPKRILTGSEMGELASSQDRDNWKDQVVGRQTLYAGPKIVKPLADRLIEYGYLPPPAPDKGYEVKWSLIETLTDTEKAAGAFQWSQTKDGEEPVFTDAEIRDHWYGMGPLTDEQRAERADRKLENQKNTLAMQQEMAPQPQPQDKLKAAGDYLGHEFHGNQWTTEGLHSPADAVHDILDGKPASVAEHDVRDFLKKSQNFAQPVDLTKLHVEGHLIFGGDGLGIARADMPQVPKEMRSQFLEEIKQRNGITATREDVDPLSLKPSQKEISAQNVATKLGKYEKDPGRPFPPILVSKDNYVLDGHHHWGMMATVRLDHPFTKIPVNRLSVNAKQGLKVMHAFDKRHGIKREAIKAAEENLVEAVANALELGDEELVKRLLGA